MSLILFARSSAPALALSVGGGTREDFPDARDAAACLGSTLAKSAASERETSDASSAVPLQSIGSN